MKIKNVLRNLLAAWIIWTWVYKITELSSDIVNEVIQLMKLKDKTDEGIKTLKLKKGNFYLLEIDWIKILVSLKNFKPSKDWDLTMDIYSGYEKGKYLRILWTVVLPKWKWNFWDTYEDWYIYIKNLPFGYKLNSYDKKKDTMDLEFISRLEWDLKITEQYNLSKFDLKKRWELSNEKIIEIYKIIQDKINK